MTGVSLENEAGGFFSILPDLFVGMLSRQWDCRFVAAAPGVNALVADLDEQPKHLGDFRLSFEEIPGGGTLFLADPHGENAGISQSKDVFIGYIVSHVERRAAVKRRGLERPIP